MIVTEKRIRGEDTLRVGFRTTDWKFLYDGKTEETFLYDLDNDPAESTDISGQNPDVVSRFQDQLESRLNRIEETSENVTVPEVETEAGVEERLKALGYRE